MNRMRGKKYFINLYSGGFGERGPGLLVGGAKTIVREGKEGG